MQEKIIQTPQEQSLVKSSSMSFWGSFAFLMHSALQEIRRRGCSYCLSFLSVMIVVAASAVSQSIIDRAPIIFLQSAEGPASQTDILIFPQYQDFTKISPVAPEYLQLYGTNLLYGTTINMLNLTRINQVLNDSRQLQTTPRQTLVANITSCATQRDLIVKAMIPQQMGSQAQQKASQDIQDIQDNYICSYTYSTSSLIVIDTEQEKKIGLGRSYPFGKLAPGECIISTKLAYGLNLKVGDYILLQSDFYDYYSMYYEYWSSPDFGYNASTYNPNLMELGFAITGNSSKRALPFQIKYLLDQSYGKISDGSIDDIVIIEQGSFFKNLAYWGFNYEYANDMYNTQPDWFVTEVHINMPHRMDVYLNSNYESIQFSVTQYASQISRDLGVYPFQMSLPILKELYNGRYSQMFLGIILNMIIVILFLLSVVLLYNLLLISVETRTYEMGVLRVLGFNKLGVVFLILTQALSYVIPAIIVGIILSIPLLVFASNMLASAVGVAIDIYPTPNAIGLSLGLGFLIPLFSSIVPIQSALAQQLSFALDLNRSKSTAVKIEIDLSDNAIPWGKIYFASISSIFGISIYFLLPLALLSFNIGLLLSIFFILLCAMLLGFVLLAFNFQYLVERVVVFVFFIWAGKATNTLILKNLASHRIKNRRTALMFSLSIAFVIFIETGMTVQINNSAYQTIQQHGTYLEVYVPTWSSSTLPISQFEFLLTNTLGDHVQNYAWITQPLQRYMQGRGYATTYMTHIGRVYQYLPTIVGVSPSLFSLGFNQFLTVDKRGPNTGLDPVEELYTARGSQSCIIGSAYASNLELNIGPNSTFLIVNQNSSITQIHELRVSSILKTAPALTFSQIPSVIVQSVVVSLPTFVRLTEGLTLTYQSIPMSRLLIQFKSNASIDYVYQQINGILKTGQFKGKIWDYRDQIKSLQQNQSLITIIFTALTAVVMTLCFFSLSSSMTANMLEQAKEISVLRAIGNTKATIIRLYIYEAFVLVLSSSSIGLVVGYCIGFSMALQQTLITQLPLFFVFPWNMLIVIFIASIVTAVFSTFFPSYKILGQEIAQIMRMN